MPEEIIYELPWYNSLSEMYRDMALIEQYKKLVQLLWQEILKELRNDKC